MTRKPAAAVQRRAAKRQAAVPTAREVVTRWYCGGCGTTLVVEHVDQINELRGYLTAYGAADVVLACAALCDQPACDARLVRCERCGGAKAAREALRGHACRASLT